MLSWSFVGGLGWSFNILTTKRYLGSKEVGHIVNRYPQPIPAFKMPRFQVFDVVQLTLRF